MTPETTSKINSLNLNFYQEVSDIWNQDPNYIWEGWGKLIKEINTLILTKKTLRVLDLGCGNGRFYSFLNYNFGSIRIEYIGLDFSKNWSQKHKDIFDSSKDCKFFEVNLSDPNWVEILANKEFDLVVAFGLFHHIPGYQNRLNLLQQASLKLDQKGILVWTTWEFLNEERLIKRILAKDSLKYNQLLQKYQIPLQEMETGDYFLDWIKLKTLYRYSHHFSNSEIQEMTRKSNLKIKEDFLADGRFSNRNRYLICHKNP